MAELGIIASVVQLADLGVRLSLRLYTFGQTAASADKSIISISKDVSLTSSVLKELGQTLQKDQEPRLCSENAFQTVDGIVKECLEVFQSMDKTLAKSVSRLGLENGQKRVWTVAALERLKWPFFQPKMQLLRSNLERLKSTLLLMLNVITYARQVADKTESRVVIANQRDLIEDLARSNMEHSRKYNDLTLAIEASHSKEGKVPQSTKSSPVEMSPSINSSKLIFDDTSNKTDKSIYLGRGWEKHERVRGLNIVDPSQQQMDWAVDKLRHYCNLVNNLLEEINSAEYKIEPDLRLRIKNDVVNAHRRERRHLRTLHGEEKLKQAITGDALNLVELDSTALESQNTYNSAAVLETHELDSSTPLPPPEKYKDYWSKFGTKARHTGIASITSITSFLKKSFLLPVSYVNSRVFRRRKGTPRRACKLHSFGSVHTRAHARSYSGTANLYSSRTSTHSGQINKAKLMSGKNGPSFQPRYSALAQGDLDDDLHHQDSTTSNTEFYSFPASKASALIGNPVNEEPETEHEESVPETLDSFSILQSHSSGPKPFTAHQVNFNPLRYASANIGSPQAKQIEFIQDDSENESEEDDTATVPKVPDTVNDLLTQWTTLNPKTITSFSQNSSSLPQPAAFHTKPL